jgi:hypothetical protein
VIRALPYETSRITRDNRKRPHVLGHDCTGSNNSTFADSHPRKNHRPRANPSEVLDNDWPVDLFETWAIDEVRSRQQPNAIVHHHIRAD